MVEVYIAIYVIGVIAFAALTIWQSVDETDVELGIWACFFWPLVLALVVAVSILIAPSELAKCIWRRLQ